MTENTTIFAKKTAWKSEIGSVGWEILGFYFPDEFLCSFFNENRDLWSLNAPSPPADMFIQIKVNELQAAC